LQPADDPRGGAVFSAGWIKNVGTFLAVQNAYGRDFDVGSLQILDCGFDGLLVRQECHKLIDGSMANSSTLIIGPSVTCTPLAAVVPTL